MIEENCILAYMSIFLALTAPVIAEENANSSLDAEIALQHDLTPNHRFDELQLLVTPLTLKQLTAEAEQWQDLLQTEFAHAEA